MQLQNDRLLVEIDVPGATYRGTRFDWTAAVTQVTLDRQHTFCVPALGPGEIDSSIAHVAGLCNEFGIFAPIGYAEAQPGEQFPKLGVGLLTKQADVAYHCMDAYPLEPFAMHVARDATSATFTLHPLPCRGYAALLTKTVALHGHRLNIRYVLQNVGSKPLLTHEYNHNFIAINQYRFGPDYVLTVPFQIELAEVPAPLAIAGNQIRWSATPATAFYCRLGGYKEREGSYWHLLHQPSGVGVRVGGDFPLQMFPLWGAAYTVCPETFIRVAVQPGATQSWERWYEFLA